MRAVICYDCKCESDDTVMETRCTGGESHGLYPQYTYDRVPVCANRRTCQENHERGRGHIVRTSVCPICRMMLQYTAATERQTKLDHLRMDVAAGRVW